MNTRRKRIAAIRADVRSNDARQLERVKRQLREARETVVLFEPDAALILRALDEKLGRGAPEMLAGFHLWIAVDALARRDRGEKAVVADKLVAKAWDVSIKLVEKVTRKHRAEARVRIDLFGRDSHVIDSNIDPFRRAFLVLGKEQP